MWKNGKNYGYGTYFWANRARYSGLSLNDAMYVKRTLVLPETDGKNVRYYV